MHHFNKTIGVKNAKDVFSRALREIISRESSHYLRNDLTILLEMIEKEEICFDKSILEDRIEELEADVIKLEYELEMLQEK